MVLVRNSTQLPQCKGHAQDLRERREQTTFHVSFCFELNYWPTPDTRLLPCTLIRGTTAHGYLWPGQYPGQAESSHTSQFQLVPAPWPNRSSLDSPQGYPQGGETVLRAQSAWRPSHKHQ